MENGGCSNWIVSIGQCLIYWVLPAECGREVPKLPACKISTIAADRGSASIHSLLLAGAVWGVWNVIFWTVFRKRWSTDRWVAADRLKFRFNSVFNSVLCCFALVLCIGCCVGPYKRYVRTVWNDDDCQNTKLRYAAWSSTLALIQYFIHLTAKILISIIWYAKKVQF